MGVYPESIDFETEHYSATGAYMFVGERVVVEVELTPRRRGQPLDAYDVENAQDAIITQIEEEQGLYLKADEIEWDFQ